LFLEFCEQEGGTSWRTGMRLAELGQVAGEVAYPAVSVAIKRFEKRLKVDRELAKKIKAVRTMLKI
jgi:hypothetical protein